MMMWDRALMKKVKQGHVSNRESVGGSLKVGERGGLVSPRPALGCLHSGT